MQNSLTKKLGLTVAAMAMAATSLFTASDAEAVPAFARQTGMSCNSCHFQAFPALNGMGRSFRAGGYTMQGVQTAITGENINLPSAMNLSAVWKTFHIKKGTQAVGEIVWPDEAAFLVGGRLSANSGFLWEVGLNEGAEVTETTTVTGTDGADHEVATAAEGGGSFLSTKVHFNVGTAGSTSFAVIPFATDALGRAYGFELMNTAMQRSQRPIEKRNAMSPAQDYNLGMGAASGIALVATDLAAGWWVNYSLWGPVHGGGQVDPTGLATWLRGGYFFDLAGFDTGVAYGMTSGVVKSSSDHGANQNYDVAVAGTSLDIQLQGELGGNPFGFYLQNAAAGDSTGADTGTATHPIAYGDGYVADGGSGTGMAFTYGIGDWKLHYANASYALGSEDRKRDSVGFDYMVAENVKIQYINYSETNGTADTVKKTYMGWFFGL